MTGILAALLAVAGCGQDGPAVAKSTLVNPSVVEFPAKGAEAAVVGVAGDGTWSLKECPEWVTVSPTEGTGHMDITVSVTDNVTGGEVDLPRSGVVIFGGNTLMSRVSLTISQMGDRYAGTPASSLADVAALSDGAMAAVKKATAVAATLDRRLISDGAGFALTDAAIFPGQTATVKGVKKTENGLPVITDSDVLDLETGTVPSPGATDVTETMDAFTGGGAYISVRAVAAAPNAGDLALAVEGSTRNVTVLKPASDLGLAGMAHHWVVVTGYGFVDGTDVVIVATAAEDQGVAMANDVLARWLFNDTTRDKLGPLFTGKATPDGSNIYKSDNVKEAGDDGKYVPAEEGDARLTYNCIDKNAIDVNGAFTRLIGKTGEPYVTGAYQGDFWEFAVTLSKTYKAGSTVHFFGIPRSSNGSLKYWLLEILDGEAWVPMLPVLEKEVTIDADGNTGPISYNCEQVGDGYLDVDANYVLVSDLSGTLRIRYRAMSNMTASASSSKYKAIPDGGTHRFAGNTRTNPYIDITYEP